MCSKAVITAERAPRVLMVIDLAIDRDDDRPVLVGDRLTSPRAIDDGEAAEDETKMLVDEQLFVVGATPAQLSSHRLQDFGPFLARLPARSRRCRSGKPAHLSPSSTPAALDDSRTVSGCAFGVTPDSPL